MIYITIDDIVNLLINSGVYNLTTISYIDNIGMLGFSYFTFKKVK